jgi:hypothetical protein
MTLFLSEPIITNTVLTNALLAILAAYSGYLLARKGKKKDDEQAASNSMAELVNQIKGQIDKSYLDVANQFSSRDTAAAVRDEKLKKLEEWKEKVEEDLKEFREDFSEIKAFMNNKNNS